MALTEAEFGESSGLAVEVARFFLRGRRVAHWRGRGRHRLSESRGRRVSRWLLLLLRKKGDYT